MVGISESDGFMRGREFPHARAVSVMDPSAPTGRRERMVHLTSSNDPRSETWRTTEPELSTQERCPLVVEVGKPRRYDNRSRLDVFQTHAANIAVS